MSKRVEMMNKMTLGQLSNPDGSFNKDCVSFEDFRKNWLDEDYINETEIAQKRIYDNTIKRLHGCYRALKENDQK